MSRTARGMPCALVAILVVAGVVTGLPVVPSLSTSPGQDTAPWSGQTTRATHSWNPQENTIETMVKVAVIVELARRVVSNLERLVAEQLGRAARDFFDSVGRGRGRGRERETRRDW